MPGIRVITQWSSGIELRSVPLLGDGRRNPGVEQPAPALSSPTQTGFRQWENILSMDAEPSSKLAEVLGALAIELQARTDSAATLRCIVDASVDIVPGARWAGISLIQGRRVKSEVPTDPIVAELDQLQTDLDEGHVSAPCASITPCTLRTCPPKRGGHGLFDVPRH
jgi:hypothetical protein